MTSAARPRAAAWLLSVLPFVWLFVIINSNTTMFGNALVLCYYFVVKGIIYFN
jgi:Flp pilus assembly protein TadB